MTDDIHQDLIEIARAVILMDQYESQLRSSDQLVLLEKTAATARDVLAKIKKEEEADG